MKSQPEGVASEEFAGLLRQRWIQCLASVLREGADDLRVLEADEAEALAPEAEAEETVPPLETLAAAREPTPRPIFPLLDGLEEGGDGSKAPTAPPAAAGGEAAPTELDKLLGGGPPTPDSG